MHFINCIIISYLVKRKYHNFWLIRYSQSSSLQSCGVFQRINRNSPVEDIITSSKPNSSYYSVYRKCICKSRHLRCSMKKAVPKNFAKLTGKHLYQNLLFNKQLYQIRDSITGVFLWIFKNTFLYRTYPGGSI